MASDCTNRRIITLAEWEAVKESEVDKDDEGDLEKTQEELIVKANEGDMLPLEQTWTEPKEDTKKNKDFTLVTYF